MPKMSISIFSSFSNFLSLIRLLLLQSSSPYSRMPHKISEFSFQEERWCDLDNDQRGMILTNKNQIWAK